MKNVKILFTRIIPVLLLFSFTFQSLETSAQRNKKKKGNEKPDWVTSRPVDKAYYQGIGVSMVNNYTQSHVEEAKKKALNDITSEISVKIKSTTLMQQIEQNDELNSLYQSQTKLSSENEIEGFELVGSWGDETQYWVYYRLSKSMYHQNKLRRLDRTKGIGSQYYESGKSAMKKGNNGRAYEDFVKGLVALKEYLDQELMISTDKGEEYLVDVLFHELIEMNRKIHISSDISNLKVRLAKPVEDMINVSATYDGKPMVISLRPYFSTGSGEVPSSILTDQFGKASFKIQRVTGGENLQVLEISTDIEGMSAEGEDINFMSRLIRLKSGPPSAKINIEATKILAYFEVEEKQFGKNIPESSMAKAVRNKLSEQVLAFTNNEENAEVMVKLTIDIKEGDARPLKNHTLYTTYVDFFISMVDVRDGKQVFYKGFSGEKGSRSGSYEKAYEAAAESVMIRFTEELLPEIGNIDL